MRVVLSFIIFIFVKIISKLFYRFEVNWLSPIKNDWTKIRLIIFLNHTSLYEPLYIGILPISFIWRLARKIVAPGADKTLNRPIVGRFWKLMSPGIMAISRKRDKTWKKFIEAIHNRSVIVIAPEGRMKRPNGLDLEGRPMTVRAGIAEIIEILAQEEKEDGRILIAYSGGLHHIQSPGEFFPRIFKTIRMNLELISIQEYAKQFDFNDPQWRKVVVKDLQHRLDTKVPSSPV